MAGADNLRALRRRIKSVQSTRKITKAMELIAASRIARAHRSVLAARPYTQGLNRVIQHLATNTQAQQHPILRTPEYTETGEPKKDRVVLVICSDRGLAGAYNINALRVAYELVRDNQRIGAPTKLIIAGNKGVNWFRYRGIEPDIIWRGVSDKPTARDAQRIAEDIIDMYTNGDIDLVDIVYTEFFNSLYQLPRINHVLPIDLSAMEQSSEGTARSASATAPATTSNVHAEYIIEPDVMTMLNAILPRYVQHQIFSSLLESAASEHASRQRAMKAASDNASDVIDNLTIQANTARQAAVTREISEIVGGADALASENKR